MPRTLSPGQRTRPGDGPAGPNPLFFGVLTVVCLAAVAAALAGDERLLRSNLVFRLAVATVTMATGYGVVAILWFAWHRLTLDHVGVAGANVQAPAQRADVLAREREIDALLERTTEAVTDLNRRLRNLESRE